MRIVIEEFQDENYENCVGAILKFDSVENMESILELMNFDTLTASEFDLFVSTWKDRADSEGVEFSVEVNEEELKAELDSILIEYLEAHYNSIDSYPCDESQTVSNAGNCEVYEYLGLKYKIITWNEEAEEHKNGEKEIAEILGEEE